jgi:hypothetical protein
MFSTEPDLFDAPEPDMETLICGLKYGGAKIKKIGQREMKSVAIRLTSRQ